MRILHVITGLGPGGAESMLLKLLRARKENWESAVVSLGRGESMAAEISELGVPVYNLNLSRAAPNPVKVFSIRSLVRRLRPHLIQGWMPHGNLMAVIAGMCLPIRVPVVWNIRMCFYDSGAALGMTKAVIRLGAPFSWYPARIIYNSETGARQHEALGYRAAKTVIIPNGFDCEIFRPSEDARRRVRAELQIRDDAILVGLIARYDPLKDHANFVRAAGLVQRWHPEVYFLLAGTGVTANEPALRRIVAAEGIEDRSFLLGERSDVPRLTAALDVACSSSWSEGFSNTIGEAMACAVPCVVTDVGENTRLVSNTGLSVAPRNPEAFAQAISRLIRGGIGYRRELGNAGRQRIQSEFSLSAVARQYEHLYQQLSVAKDAGQVPAGSS